MAYEQRPHRRRTRPSRYDDDDFFQDPFTREPPMMDYASDPYAPIPQQAPPRRHKSERHRRPPPLSQDAGFYPLDNSAPSSRRRPTRQDPPRGRSPGPSMRRGRSPAGVGGGPGLPPPPMAAFATGGTELGSDSSRRHRRSKHADREPRYPEPYGKDPYGREEAYPRDPYGSEAYGREPRRRETFPREMQSPRGYGQDSQSYAADPRDRSDRQSRARSRGGDIAGGAAAGAAAAEFRPRKSRGSPRGSPPRTERTRGRPSNYPDYEDDSHHRRRPRSQGRDRDYERPRSPARSRPPPRTRAPPPQRRNSMPATSSKSRKSAWWQNPYVQAGARTAFTAGAQAAMKSHNDPSPWLGAKGAKVATAALGAALVDGFMGQKHPGGVRHKVMREGVDVAAGKVASNSRR